MNRSATPADEPDILAATGRIVRRSFAILAAWCGPAAVAAGQAVGYCAVVLRPIAAADPPVIETRNTEVPARISPAGAGVGYRPLRRQGPGTLENRRALPLRLLYRSTADSAVADGILGVEPQSRWSADYVLPC
jgi:hypothetical protein